MPTEPDFREMYAREGHANMVLQEYYSAALAEHVATIAALRAEVEGLTEALTPSAETKAAYIGEVKFSVEDRDEDGEPCERAVTVTWSAMKEFMALIRERAALLDPQTPGAA